MKILYAARMARFDLLRAMCALACMVTKWTPACDRALLRLVCYIHSSNDVRLFGWVGARAQWDFHLSVYCDADFAGCAGTKRSTSGAIVFLSGIDASFPLSAVSKTDGGVS